jgi:hypothetical protein
MNTAVSMIGMISRVNRKNPIPQLRAGEEIHPPP